LQGWRPSIEGCTFPGRDVLLSSSCWLFYTAFHIKNPFAITLFVLALPLLFGMSVAQRPSNASIYDYYAQQRHGTNNSDTQFELVQSIVSLAFGGKFNLSNVSSEITGILNLGKFISHPVYLRPWFDGTLDSTNLNDQPIGINWLDAGGLDPLYNYLSGVTTNVALPLNSNQ